MRLTDHFDKMSKVECLGMELTFVNYHENKIAPVTRTSLTNVDTTSKGGLSHNLGRMEDGSPG